MRYSPDIIKQITSELEKAPNIRYVCTKVGIDHSTFYRWMRAHMFFLREVTAALDTGRSRMNDTAESVIISGIQNKQFRAAAFWLTHNDERYMSREKADYFQRLHEKMIRMLGMDEKQLPPEYPPTFEKLFKAYKELEDNFDKEAAYEIIKPLIDIFRYQDDNLVDVFFASYEGWKQRDESLRKDAERLGIEYKEDE